MGAYANDYTVSVTNYYTDLKKYKPISMTKERRLIRLCKRGNDSAKKELIESNLRFVFNIAKKYAGRGIPIADLISDGNLGMIRAIDKFDETKGIRFISYAVWWIKQAMLESISKQNRMNFVESSNDDEEIDSDIENITCEEYHCDIFRNNKYNCLELSYSMDDENKESEIDSKQKDTIESIMCTLSDKEREIIESYFGINGKPSMFLFEIGEKYNLSSERVRQIKEKALRKMRSQMLIMDIDKDDLFL